MEKTLEWLRFYGGKPIKFFRIMKLLIILLTVTSLTISAKTFSQYRVTLNVRNVGVMELFREIQKKTNLYFVYNVNDLKQFRNLSVTARNEEVGTVLQKVFGDQKLDFVYEGNVIIVKPRPESTVPQKKMVIRGLIKDSEGNVLPGVTVLLRGTNIGVSTDAQGHFEMTLPAQEKVFLEFSFIGMQKQTLEYKGQELIQVVMKAEELSLDEVVVTGYQVIDKREQTSAITSVKASDILIPGMTSLDQALEGRIPELMLMSNSGEIGATPRIRIRGTSTLLGNREPLWVLDGVIMSDPVKVDPTELNDPDYLNIVGNAIAGINPQDIERIDVLKDASATALYGTRAANGVIVVTTKKGAIGKARISYNHTSKYTRRPRYTDRNINLMNSQERVQFGKDLADMHYVFPSGMLMVGYEGALHRYYTGLTNYDDFLKEVKWYESVNTDWFDILTRDTYSQGHNLSISGGSDDVRYYASIGYDNEDGVSETTYLKRYTMRVNLDADITKNLKVFLKLSGNVQKKNNLMDGLDAMDYAYNTTRALPCFNEDGSLFYYENRAYGTGFGDKKFRYNILNEIDNSSNEYNGNTVGANLELKYKVFQCWEVDVMGSYSRSSTLQEKWWGEKSHYVALLKNGENEEAPIAGEDGQCQLPYGGVLKTSNTNNENYTLRVQSDFRKVFGRDQQHLITNTIGFEANGNTVHASSEENRMYVKERGMKFVNDIELDKYPHYKNWLKNNANPTIQHGITNMLAGYMTLAYGYKRHFIVNANFRFDASNKFGDRSNEKLLPVWSVSGMWNGKENLLKNVNLVSDMQWRISYGKQGNMLETMSPNLIIQQGVIDPYYEENVSQVYSFPNPNLMWEQTHSLNTSLDVSLLDSRLTLSGTFYYKKTFDCFTDVNVSSVNGISTYVMNGGDLENKGYTVQVSGIPVKRGRFRWNLSGYASVNLNTVQTNTAQNYSLSNYLNGTALIDGEAVGSFYSYRFKGLNPQNGTPVFDDYSDRRHLLKNKNLEEVVLMTMENSGSREPKVTGGVQTSFSWKGLSLMANFTYSLGSKVRLFPLYSPISGGVRAQTNVRKEFLERWQKPGDEKYTNIPVILSTSDPLYSTTQNHFSNVSSDADREKTKITQFATNIWDMYDKSDFRVVSGNYLKCSSLTIRYIVDNKYLKKTPFSAVSVSLSGTNLFTWSAKDLKGQDPSQAGFAKPNLSLRPSYTLGVNVSF